jgi:hypothetical protein
MSAPQLFQLRMQLSSDAMLFPGIAGENKFRCLATYVDGSTSFYAAYWTCPVMYRQGGFDLWGVLGKSRIQEVTIRASARHERYTELACWVFEPRNDRPNEFPQASIGFDYSQI